ncbi:MAG: hypothetical protein DRI01_07195 [Chloroflexi bacterium]|nr:MAG: hypothetical protein DRI01_07195 [Chloroflexota bacterium]
MSKCKNCGANLASYNTSKFCQLCQRKLRGIFNEPWLRPGYYTPSEAASLLGMNEEYVRRCLRQKRYPEQFRRVGLVADKVGRKWQIRLGEYSAPTSFNLFRQLLLQFNRATGLLREDTLDKAIDGCQDILEMQDSDVLIQLFGSYNPAMHEAVAKSWLESLQTEYWQHYLRQEIHNDQYRPLVKLARTLEQHIRVGQQGDEGEVRSL